MNSTEKKNLQLVKVYVRQRPYTKNEIELRRPSVVQTMSLREIFLKSNLVEKKYTFDEVFGNLSAQADVYNTVVAPMIEHVLSGYTCTVFAYGQTGTGKTYTMIGENISPSTDFDNDPSLGMIPRAAVHLFSELEKGSAQYVVKVSFIEIYNEEIRDLLVEDSPPLRIYDDPENKGATCVKGLIETEVANTRELYDVLVMGTSQRQTAATNLNRHSSRSHTIFTIIVNTREITSDAEQVITTGKLHLIDLAGSENIGRSGATEMRAREAGTINKSLLTLGKVIKSLVLKMQHIPYRESKLTRILQDSLGGKSKTCMIATFSPCNDAFEETVSTLDYAHVARNIANCPIVNIKRRPTNVLKNVQHEVTKLRMELNAARAGEGFYISQESFEKMDTDIKHKKERVEHLMMELATLEENKRRKEQEFNELNSAFEKTKTNVEDVEKQLKKERKIYKKNEIIKDHISKDIVELNDILSNLFDVFESSKQHTEIYSKKYDKQCLSTIHNARVVKNIHQTFTESIKSLEKCVTNYHKEQNIVITDSLVSAQKVQEIALNNVEKLIKLQDQTKAQPASVTVTFDTLFKNGEFSELRLTDTLCGYLNKAGNVQLEKLQDDSTSIKNFEKIVSEISHSVMNCKTNTVNSVKRQFENDSKNTKSWNGLQDKIYADLQNRYRSIQEDLSNIRSIKDLHVEIAKRTEQRCKHIENELITIQNLDEDMGTLLDLVEGSMLEPLEKMKEALNKYMDSAHFWNQIVGLIENKIDGMKENKKVVDECITLQDSESQEYIWQFMKAFKHEMSLYNQRINGMFASWVREFETIRIYIEGILDDSAIVNDHMENHTQRSMIHGSDLEQFIQQTLENLHALRNDADTNRHAGDTPIKPEYKYPKKIDSESSERILQEKLLQLPQDSPAK